MCGIKSPCTRCPLRSTSLKINFTSSNPNLSRTSTKVPLSQSTSIADNLDHLLQDSQKCTRSLTSTRTLSHLRSQSTILTDNTILSHNNSSKLNLSTVRKSTTTLKSKRISISSWSKATMTKRSTRDSSCTECDDHH